MAKDFCAFGEHFWQEFCETLKIRFYIFNQVSDDILSRWKIKGPCLILCLHGGYIEHYHSTDLSDKKVSSRYIHTVIWILTSKAQAAFTVLWRSLRSQKSEGFPEWYKTRMLWVVSILLKLTVRGILWSSWSQCVIADHHGYSTPFINSRNSEKHNRGRWTCIHNVPTQGCTI